MNRHIAFVIALVAGVVGYVLGALAGMSAIAVVGAGVLGLGIAVAVQVASIRSEAEGT